MILRLSVLVLIAVVASVFLLEAGSAPSASALVTPVAFCDAKHGVQENTNVPPHPINYPQKSPLAITLGNPGTNGVRDIEMNATDPVIDLSGTVDALNWITASGHGTYSGFETDVDFTGRIAFYDNDPTVIRLVGGYTLIGAAGELNNGDAIGYLMFCPTNPEDEDVADKDHDSVAAKVFTDTVMSSQVTAEYDPPEDVELVWRDTQAVVHQVTMPNSQKISIVADISAAFEAIAERRYNDVRSTYGAAWDPSISGFDFFFPAALGSNAHDDFFAGNLVGVTNVYSNAAPGGFEILFNGLGGSVPFQGTAANTGTWRLYSPEDPGDMSYGGLYDYGSEYFEEVDEEYEVDYDPATGLADVTLALLFESPNLALASSGLSSAGADFIGDPVPMTATIRDIPVTPPIVNTALDNCPVFANASQIDSDGDGVGDICEGFFWGDPTCDGFAALLDALDTLRVIVGGAELPARAGCPHFQDIFGDIVFGDWNCDGSMNPLDALILIARAAAATRPTPVGGCPDLGDFVPASPI